VGAPIINSCMNQYTSIQVSCVCCKKILSVKGIHTHYIASHTVDGKQTWKASGAKGGVFGKEFGTNTKRKNVEKYLTAPKHCLQCSAVMSYENRQNKFCSQSCAATHNNLKLVGKRKYGPAKSSNLTKYEKQKLNKNIVGPYSAVYRCKCKVCGKETILRFYKKFCAEHRNNYSHNGRANYWFTFKLSDYPDLFDFTLLKTYGMRSRGKNNINGVVRDHKVSVADAIRNNYDPYYIKHPLNCELLLNSDNAKKHKASSMTYEELVYQVDEYEKRLTGLD